MKSLPEANHVLGGCLSASFLWNRHFYKNDFKRSGFRQGKKVYAATPGNSLTPNTI